jgi:hypothetical protein
MNIKEYKTIDNQIQLAKKADLWVHIRLNDDM